MNEVEYIVTNIYTSEEYITKAVSEIDAINHVHYNLWFRDRIWTEMSDYVAEASIIKKMKELKNDKRRDKATGNDAGTDEETWNNDKEQYVQMSFSF